MEQMTCIVGYIDGNVIIMAADSAATGNDIVTIRKGVSKLWKPFPNSIMGGCGSFGIINFVRYGFKWPTKTKDTMKWLVKDVQPALCKSIQKRFPKDAKDEYDWTFILGIDGRLFVLYPCGDVEENAEVFASIGSGGIIATSVLFAKKDTDLTSWEKMECALEIASKMDIYTRSPWTVEYTV